MVSAGRDGNVRIWDGPTMRCIRTEACEPARVVLAAAGEITDPSSVVLSAGRDQTLRSDLTTAETRPLWRYELPPSDPDPELAVAIGQIAGRLVIGGGLEDLWWWDASTGEALFGLAHPGEIRAAAAVTLGRESAVATGDERGVVRYWNPLTGGHRIWGRRWLPLRRPHTGPVRDVTVGVIGGKVTVVSGGEDGAVRLWDPAAGAPGAELPAPTPVHSLALADSGGQTIVLAGYEDGTMRIWDPTTAQVLLAIDTGSAPVASLSVHEVGERTMVAAGTGKHAHVIELLRRPATVPPPAAEATDLAPAAPLTRAGGRGMAAARWLTAWLVAALGAVLWLAVLGGAAGATFLAADDNDAVEPAPGTEHPGTFDPWRYGFDVVVPLLDLGQDQDWRPVATEEQGDVWINARLAFLAAGWAVTGIFALEQFAYLIGWALTGGWRLVAKVGRR